MFAIDPSCYRPLAWRNLLALATPWLLLTASANALPAAGYRVDLIPSQPGATSTSVRGVDAAGRVLGYWNFFSQPFPRPIGAEPDDEGYFLWDSGTSTPLTIPGLTDMNIHRMNVSGAMWGRSNEGAFVYRDGNLSILQSPATDVTLVQGVDGSGRIYGILGNYPAGVDPDDPLVPIEPVSNFVWENGVFSDLNLLLADAIVHGVRQDGTLWGANAEVSFLQDGANLTILDHPDFDYTGVLMSTAAGEAFGFALTLHEDLTTDSSHFFWDPLGGFQEWPRGANLPGTDVSPAAMNERGVFWGFGLDGAFVATPIPEPSTAALLALGLAMLRRRSTA